jgi:hypothetical protein
MTGGTRHDQSTDDRDDEWAASQQQGIPERLN